MGEWAGVRLCQCMDAEGQMRLPCPYPERHCQFSESVKVWHPLDIELQAFVAAECSSEEWVVIAGHLTNCRWCTEGVGRLRSHFTDELVRTYEENHGPISEQEIADLASWVTVRVSGDYDTIVEVAKELGRPPDEVKRRVPPADPDWFEDADQR